MDLVERIETSRFLGQEFLAWVWFSRDVTEGDIETPDLGLVDVALESQIFLADPIAIDERVTIRGADPCSSAEADQALKMGKLPVKVALRLIRNEAEWIATLDGSTLSLRSVRLPAIEAEDEEEAFVERMARLEELDDILHELYRSFLRVRLSPAWRKKILPAMCEWVQGNITLSLEEHRKLHA